MAEYLLVMTATIIPAQGVVIPRSDPAERLGDYRKALAYWLAYPHPKTRRILFLENSGASLDSLKQLVAENNPYAKQVEFLSITGSPIPAGLTYGFAEMELVDSGVAQSQLAREATHIVKLTGRLTFPLLGKLIDSLPDDFQVSVDTRIRGKVMFVPSQLMIFSREFYNTNLRGACYELDPNYETHVEGLFFDKLVRFRNRPGVFLRWPFNVDPVGVSGHGQVYQSPKRKLASHARNLLRRVAPSLWL